MRQRALYDLLPGKTTARAWQSGVPGSWLCRRIEYGTYGTYGWWVRREGRRWDGCWTVVDEREACELVTQFMRSATGWVEVPAGEQTTESTVNES
jgi:hypothetical protein